VTDPVALYRFANPPKTGKAAIVGGPSGFKVTFEKREYDKNEDQVSIFVSVPRNLKLFAGLQAVVVFVTGAKRQVPTLPRSAVRGQAQRGEVITIDASGKKRPTKVSIGKSDDMYVEVRGVGSSTEVLLYPLDSDFDE
jgi:hypothetical protein